MIGNGFRPGVVAVLALATVFLGAGCSGPQKPFANVPKPFSYGFQPPIANPLDAYLESPSDRLALEHASDILVRRCMVPFGFGFLSQAFPSERPAQELVGQSRLYGITGHVPLSGVFSGLRAGQWF